MKSDEVMKLTEYELNIEISKIKDIKLYRPCFWTYNIENAWVLAEEIPGFVIGKVEDGQNVWWSGNDDFDAGAETAPISICRAWMIWKTQ